MAIQKWSETITVVELQDDPQFAEDLNEVVDELDAQPTDVVLNFGGVDYINSSNVALLLRLRKIMAGLDRKLILCEVARQVGGVFSVTGLDNIFEFTNDVSTALASIQLAAGSTD